MTRILCTMLLLGAPLFAASAQAVSDSASIQAAELDYGLHIVSYPAHSDEFTGLALEDGKAIPVKGKTLEMSFNLFNRPDNVFGCIFRIITDKGDNVDLMYTADLQDARKLILVTGDQVHFIATEIPMEQWFPVRIGLNTKDGTIDLDYNGAKFSVRDAGTKGAKTFRISFGLCQLAGYTLLLERLPARPLGVQGHHPEAHRLRHLPRQHREVQGPVVPVLSQLQHLPHGEPPFHLRGQALFQRRRHHPRGRPDLREMRRLLTVLILTAATVSASAQGPYRSSITYESYEGLVMAGYQGWFNTPGDGAGRNWHHYEKGKRFEPGWCTIDLWPEVDEYR